MKIRDYKTWFRNLIFIVICVLINYLGKELAEYLSLPLWLDCVGTVLIAYVLGPVWGALVGVCVNILYATTDFFSIIYAITSIFIAVTVGLFAKRQFFKSFFQSVSISVLVAFVSTIISVIVNVLFFDGMTTNIWGDGVVAFLIEEGFPRLSCYIVGEFYIDFLDKIVTFVIIYIFLNAKWKIVNKAKVSSLLAILLAFSLSVSLLNEINVNAASTDNDNYQDNYTSYVQTIYNSNNGLPCSEANDIVETDDGILWFGTYSGLYRFNGSEIVLQSQYESIKNVNCMLVDDSGRLWIGTNDNGFSILTDDNITDIVDTDSGLSSNSIRCMTESSDGTYYIGTSSSMHVVSNENDKLSVVQDIPEVVYAVCLSADNNNHVATIDTNGILYLIEDGKILSSLTLDEGQEVFNDCAFDENGILYVGTSANHIYTYDISNENFKRLKTYTCGNLATINCIYFNDGGVFVCADNGVGYLDEKMKYTDISTGSFNNSIDNMTVDYQGNYWFASSRLGILRLSDSRVTDYYEAIGVSRKVVNSSTFWNGLLYVGTDTGLDILDLGNAESVENELTKLLTGIRIRCIKTDSGNNLWVCTYGSGLWKVDDEFNITTFDTKNGKFGDRARTVMEMSDGMIVAAGDNGIIFIDNDDEVTNSFTYGAGLSNAMILSLMEMDDGTLMAGSDGDGISIIKNGKVTRTITREDGLSSGVILRTVNDSFGDGTFVVTSNALCYINGDYTVDILENFPYFNNYDIWETGDGNLYVLGSGGIYIVNRDELLSGDEINYELLDTKNGLSTSLTVNSWNECTNGSYLYLSCDDGVYGIDMMDNSGDDTVYRMSISSVRLDRTLYDVNSNETLNVERGVGRIEFIPEILNYTAKNPYMSYYLEGFENTATVVEQSELGSIVYTNVPPGTYTFHLAILDDDKTTVIDEITYTIFKEKEIYDNDWFVAYMIIVLLMFGCWFTWFIVRTQIQGTLNYQLKALEFAREQIEMGNQTILTIAHTVDSKDENTSQHSQRVSEYSVLIAHELGKTDEECELLRKTALLHDIGKIGIPDSVLNKPGKLTDEEYELMKSHTLKGAEILKDFTIIENVWEGALYHHERYDGTGYPYGYSGEAIPINARIIGIADAFDAMTANRVYRKKLDFDYVLSELKKGRGKQFDPNLVDILLKLIDDGKIDIAAIYS